uniref:Uncharacterized protein n=1 Tax=Solanum tuberosum TaxID=4113 RepID=M1D803_SOLTU
MVRTKATAVTTPTPARQGAPEPTIGAASRGRAVARGHGRGHGRRPTRGRGQTPSPARDRSVTPPPTDEIAREGDEGEDEQIQEKEVPAQSTPEMINRVLTYLSGLFDQGEAPPSFSALAPQVQGVQHAVVVVPPHGCVLGNRHVSLIDYRAYNDWYTTQLCFSPQEQIHRFAKGLRSDLQTPALQVAASAKSFQEVVDFVIEVEGVKPDDFTKVSIFKNYRKGGEFSDSYSKGQSSGGYPPRPNQSSL